MARVEIRHKCITIAREAARRESRARETGRSVFIKRYYGRYKLLAVEVSAKQRSCRDLFAEAQKMASSDLSKWNRRRHWERLAKRHKVKGAHRMAVSGYYRLLKDNEGRLGEAMTEREERVLKLGSEERGKEMKALSIRTRESREQAFLYKKFGDIGEYYEKAMRLAS